MMSYRLGFDIIYRFNCMLLSWNKSFQIENEMISWKISISPLWTIPHSVTAEYVPWWEMKKMCERLFLDKTTDHMCVCPLGQQVASPNRWISLDVVVVYHIAGAGVIAPCPCVLPCKQTLEGPLLQGEIK